MKRTLNILAYLVVLILSITFFYYGSRNINSKISKQGTLSDSTGGEEELNTMVFAQIVSIDGSEADKSNPAYWDIQFTAKAFGNRQNNGKIIHGQQILHSDVSNTVAVSVGDKVVLLSYDNNYVFQYFYRFDKIIILGLIFMLSLILMGGLKGFNIIISLALTCLSIFMIFIPSIRAGFNIYLSSVGICLYIIIVTMIIVYGVSKKSVTAALSCIAGVIFSIILNLIMDQWMKLTGYINDTMFNMNNVLGIQVDVKAIMFSMITIGALGAVMDVSMSITSSLCELKENRSDIHPAILLKSGFRIGRDIMGTMANTLILAYIGSSLVVVLIYAASNYPLLSVFNKEEIIFEFLQSLIGSLSLMFTIPFTTVFASMILTGKNRKLEHSMRHSQRARR